VNWSESDLAAYQARRGVDPFQEIIERNGFNPTEEVDHMAVARYLNTLGIFWFHPANGGKRGKAEAGKLKAMGVVPGCPDFIILDAPPLLPCAKGVALELKRAKGGRFSEEQAAFLEKMSNRGWITIVAHGANEALDFLRQLGWRIGEVK
jgi:hypothetical protein